jgi:hypothetical protein
MNGRFISTFTGDAEILHGDRAARPSFDTVKSLSEGLDHVEKFFFGDVDHYMALIAFMYLIILWYT